MEITKQQKTHVILHISGGIRRNLKLKGGVPPAVREEILWK